MKPDLNLNQANTRLIALALVALGLALRLQALGSESLWYDELLQLDIAQGALPTIFPRLRGHAAVPLDYLISHFWIYLGRSDGWVRIPPVVIGTLTLPLAYQLGRWLLGRAEGLLLLALLAVSPFHIRYSQEVRPYALILLGTILAGYAFWRLRQTGRWRYIVPLQIGLLTVSLAHFFGLAIYGPLIIFAAVDFFFNQQRQGSTRSLVALLAATLLPLAVLLALGWGQTLFYSSKDYGEALIEPERLIVEAAQKPNHGTGPQVDWTFIKYEILAPLVGGGRDISLRFSTILAGLGLLYLLAQKKFKVSLLLLLWLVLPIFSIISFLMFRGTFFASRYIIAVLPVYLLLLAVGLLALPRGLRRAKPGWLSVVVFLGLAGFLFSDLVGDVVGLYQNKNKENWHLVGEVIARNAGPEDAIIAVRAEPALNWYYPPAWTAPNYYWDLATIQATAASAERSWVILSIYSALVDDDVELWLNEAAHRAVRFDIDPLIRVYYFSPAATPEQLLAEVRGFVLPVDHALYASLGQQNRREPAIARRYFQLAIEHAPDDEIRAEYQAALDALAQR